MLQQSFKLQRLDCSEFMQIRIFENIIKKVGPRQKIVLRSKYYREQAIQCSHGYPILV